MQKTSQETAVQRFYEIEQQKLMLDFEKVALFTSHGPSLGAFREHRLRQYIRDFTPHSLEIGSGFVTRTLEGSGRLIDDQTRQIDCLVYATKDRQPVLQTDDYVIVEPEAVYAAIEVKSVLTLHRGKYVPDEPRTWSGTMIDALRNIASVARVLGPIRPTVFLGIFAYDMSFDWRRLYEGLDDRSILNELEIDHLDLLPNAICVTGKAIIAPGAQDFTETAPHFDPYRSHFNYIGAKKSAPAFPIQMFSTWYTNQVPHRLSGRIADRGGLFAVTSATVEIFSHHFDLVCTGHED